MAPFAVNRASLVSHGFEHGSWLLDPVTLYPSKGSCRSQNYLAILPPHAVNRHDARSGFARIDRVDAMKPGVDWSVPSTRSGQESDQSLRVRELRDSAFPPDVVATVVNDGATQ